MSYTWDKLGNMTSRRDQGQISGSTRDEKQTFCYDGLNRLIKNFNNTVTGNCVGLASADQDQRYDAFGNITYKAGVGNYNYGSVTLQPHAVQSTSDGFWLFQ